MGKALRLTYVAQKKNTGKKVFKETKMWPFVRGNMLYLLFFSVTFSIILCFIRFSDVIRSRFAEEWKPDDQLILTSISTVLANSGDDEGGVAKRKTITAVRRASGEQEMKRLAALGNEDELAPVNLV
ncbi:hypothetical protein GHT06_013515 [Daphnia sinensis]|uniref:Uncharacterized protein n=1 Tax=Daphnia sinensis TaxID=1820382 RepID=A0AAD5LKN7_9CRUS|nr:hypothetical protein GHT06_013515 [Daphnia sinensis]